jgi:hypothetical protein
MDILFDIVIPVGPNDLKVINNMIEHTKKNIIGYRNIYLVSFDPNIVFKNCFTIDENIFPFNKESIVKIIGITNRLGWYLQQLIKLYSPFVIDGLLNNYLVIDSDTYFLKPTSFFSNKLPLYNPGSEYHIPYFEHMYKLHPSFTRKTNYSGISHHMIFQKNILTELFKLIENYHKTEFWKAFLLCINKKDINGSGASEYEIYFHYLHLNYKNLFIVRPLHWENTNNLIFKDNLDYISYHWYMR